MGGSVIMFGGYNAASGIGQGPVLLTVLRL